MRSSSMLTSGAILSLPATALAQSSPYTIHIAVDPPVIEPGQTAEIELRAGFDGDRDYAMHAVFMSLLCSSGGDAFSGIDLISPLDGVGTSAGAATPLGVEGIVAGQRNIPTADLYADPTNPIPFWRGTYTAGPVVGATQAVEVRTETTRYAVYPFRRGEFPESRLNEFDETAATLRIVACRADFNGDGMADLFDFLAFLNAFDAGEILADFDFDGELTVFDFLAFQNRFDAGCP